MNVLIDSNIIIDFFANNPKAVAEITKYKNVYISVISYIEVMTGLDENESILAQDFFDHVKILWIDQFVAKEAIKLRAQNKIKLPDAIILATAIVKDLTLITRDEGVGLKNNPIVKHPYKI